MGEGKASSTEGTTTLLLAFIKSIPEKAKEYIDKLLMCYSNGMVNEICIYTVLRFITVVGGFLLSISAIFTLLYRYGLCCCKPLSAKKTEEEDNVRKEFEQMQMQMQIQMQQEQLLRALMRGSPLHQEDEDSEEEEEDNKRGTKGKNKKKGSKGKNTNKNKNSMDNNLHIGYNGTS
ncbi:hypothetical protein POVCU1_061720 [Plasmodium ovale curtisi]|uniref:Uncharacterized protein n=1 Tax=Plasmodium ovale curtisi TaxID=864141 RepID=A0A1A8X8U9_PLAOA|nr:hypothetical protein POVCU1_061720 [Plasmodium ovale curtisi]